MILDLKKLRASGKECESFFFEYLPDDELLDMPNAVMDLPVKISGEITLTDRHSAYVEGEIAFTVKGECTRCLAPAQSSVVIDFAEQVDNENENGYRVVNDKIDLTKIVDDAIIINAPTTLLCREDCKGICAGCGVNLNEDDCKCNK